MGYLLSGHFIEACDCTVICPCWVDDEPEGGHCTGLVAWDIETGWINGTDVTGARVVSVSTHGGFRRDGNRTTTVLFIDTSGCAGSHRGAADAEDSMQIPGADPVQLLVEAFSGESDGPLEGLAGVSGVVVDHGLARVSIDGAGGTDGWSVTVHRAEAVEASGGEGPEDDELVMAEGSPKVFDREEGRTEPLVMRHTALSSELGVPEHDQEVEAQDGHCLQLNVGALPGGSLEVSSRSGMRGAFEYEHEFTGVPA